jgi:hypothetical protein
VPGGLEPGPSRDPLGGRVASLSVCVLAAIVVSALLGVWYCTGKQKYSVADVIFRIQICHCQS